MLRDSRRMILDADILWRNILCYECLDGRLVCADACIGFCQNADDEKKRLRFKSEHSHDDNKQTNIRLIVKSALYISESFFCGSM